jgi:hypothetical protein
MARPKGSKDKQPRIRGGPEKDIFWAYKHMSDEPGTEGEAPSGGAKAWLKEARDNPSKFLATVAKLMDSKHMRAGGQEEKEELASQDVHYSETIDRLFKEWNNDRPRTIGGRGPARTVGKPSVAAVYPGPSPGGQGAAAASA